MEAAEAHDDEDDVDSTVHHEPRRERGNEDILACPHGEGSMEVAGKDSSA